MERTISMEDRIRRAEEIYYRRNQVALPKRHLEKASFKLKILKKMTIQTLVSSCLFTSLFMILNRNTQFATNVKDGANKILVTNTDFKAMYDIASEKIKEFLPVKKEDQLIDNQNVITQENKTLKEEILPLEQKKALINTKEAKEVKEEKPKDKMQENAEYVKKNISIIKPLNGTITSRFGFREDVKPPSFHKGIDIAARTGTVITSAMNGTATIVSTQGSFGQHIKITNGEISTIYAHCSKLYIKQGDYIKQGQPIAEVGSTGHSTGPHLHFEIRRNEEPINPDLILEF